MLKRWLVLLLALACFAAALPALAEDDWEDEDDDYDWYDEEDDSDWYDDNYETEEDYWEDTGDDYDSDHSSHSSSNNKPQYTAYEEYTVTVHVPPKPGTELRVGDVLFQWEGFSIQLLGTGISKDASGAPGLFLRCRFINTTGKTLFVHVAEATLNGVPMQGWGMSGIRPNTDDGEDSLDGLLLLPMEGDAGEGPAAVYMPQEAHLTMLLLDESNLETITSAVVTLALNDASA